MCSRSSRPAECRGGDETETETKTEAGAGAEAEADGPSPMSAPQVSPPGVNALRFPSPYRVYPVHPLTSMLPPERACMAILSNARADMRTLKKGGRRSEVRKDGGQSRCIEEENGGISPHSMHPLPLTPSLASPRPHAAPALPSLPEEVWIPAPEGFCG